MRFLLHAHTECPLDASHQNTIYIRLCLNRELEIYIKFTLKVVGDGFKSGGFGYSPRVGEEQWYHDVSWSKIRNCQNRSVFQIGVEELGASGGYSLSAIPAGAAAAFKWRPWSLTRQTRKMSEWHLGVSHELALSIDPVSALFYILSDLAVHFLAFTKSVHIHYYYSPALSIQHSKWQA